MAEPVWRIKDKLNMKVDILIEYSKASTEVREANKQRIDQLLQDIKALSEALPEDK